MPIPLTVIGGFLGVGKTSLVNHLLRNGHAALRRAGERFRRHQHRCGADRGAERWRDAGADQWLRLLQSLGDDFGGALNTARRPGEAAAGACGSLRRAGVSDPWRIAQLALIEPGFALGCAGGDGGRRGAIAGQLRGSLGWRHGATCSWSLPRFVLVNKAGPGGRRSSCGGRRRWLPASGRRRV